MDDGDRPIPPSTYFDVYVFTSYLLRVHYKMVYFVTKPTHLPL